MRQFVFTSALIILIACGTENEINPIAHTANEINPIDNTMIDLVTQTVTGTNNTCQHDRSAYIDAEVISLGQDAWSPGWNTIAEFTLTTDKDTCFDQTFDFDFTTTDDADTDWNDCEEYVGQDRFHIYRANGDELNELNADWSFYGATGEWGAYVHYCESGRFIINAVPEFVHEDTTLLADEPITFVVMMEAWGSTDDMMRVDLWWNDASLNESNNLHHHQREGEPLLFEDSNE
ncbi:MAG: hypothetical protein AAB776_04390 [Patescibacteria group bacterium]